MSLRLISRESAIEQGLIKYFTGIACVNGHIKERYACSGACIDCIIATKEIGKLRSKALTAVKREAKRAQKEDEVIARKRARKKLAEEKRKATAKTYRAANKEKYNAYNRAYNKPYKDSHKPEIANKSKDYYAKNREIILNKMAAYRLKKKQEKLARQLHKTI